MENSVEIVISLLLLLACTVIYSAGVLTRWAQNNNSRPLTERSPLQLSLLGESLPGLFELVVTLAAVFGGVVYAKSQGSIPQSIGLLASAAYFSFRAGFSFSESFLKVRNAQHGNPPPTLRGI
jgi:uncharacterized SAM-binding protein YcdF (DUF218 family)